MKKYLLGLLLCTSATYALELHWGCEHLKIVISNNTPDSCLLVDKHLKHGVINRSSNIPGEILSGTKTLPIIIDEQIPPPIMRLNPGTELFLTYTCGKTHQITIRSQKDACIFGSNMQAQIISASDMDATYDVTLGDFWSAQPG